MGKKEYLITLEEHFTDRRIMSENAKYNKPRELTKEELSLIHI